jgi:hypothetical protein
MVDPVTLVGCALGGVVALVIGGVVGRTTAPVDRQGLNLDAIAEPDIDPDAVTDEEIDEFSGYVELHPPSTSGNLVLSLYRAWKHGMRQRKLARRGYVRWIRVKNGVWADPAYIKPEEWVGSPFPIYRHDGGKYYFPRKAGVVDENTGIRTFVHREGEAEPVNLDESDGEVLSAEDLKQAEEMELATSPPSLLDRLDVDLTPQTILAGGIGLIMVFAAIRGFV